MNWTIDIQELPPFFNVKLQGPFDLFQFRQMVEEVGAAKNKYLFCPVLFDDRELDVSHVTDDDLMSVSNIVIANNPSFACSKVAILMRTVPDFELAMSFQKITQSASMATINVFRDEYEARSWLGIW